jgi:glycosyltransferase involved in cell wall biosynthesis
VKAVRLNHNLGRALIRNEGVRQLGQVDYILSMDCDDYLSPTYIELLVRALEAAPDAGLAYGLLQYVGEIRDGAVSKTWPDKHWRRETIYHENLIPGPGTMFRAKALAEIDGWRGDFTKCSGEDYDIWLQVVEAGWKPIWDQKAIYFYRQHENSFLASADLNTQLEVELNILKHHHSGIRQSIGVEAYLKKLIGPELLRAIRIGDKEKARRLSQPLWSFCPGATVWMLVKYYYRRVLTRMKRYKNSYAR